QPAARDRGLNVARDLHVVLGLEEAGIDRRTGQAIVLHHFGQHQSFLRVPGAENVRGSPRGSRGGPASWPAAHRQRRDPHPTAWRAVAALLASLDPKLLIEQAPPDHDSFAGEFGIDFVDNTGDAQAAVNADQASFGLARKGAETLPGAHLT